MSQRVDDGDDEQSRADLVTQLELLAEENERLRQSYAHAKQTQYRRTAVGLAAVGIVAVLGAVAVPTARTVLFALGGIGLFGGVLTYYLTPEQFIPADVGRDVYAALADNQSALAGDLGLSDERVYVPTGRAETPVRLFVPQDEAADHPPVDALEETIIADDGHRGLALTPSAHRLFGTLETALTGSIGETPDELAAQLTDALLEQFELVSAAEPEVDADGQRLSVAVSGSVYGPVDQFDHPVVSLLAVGLATGLNAPISTTVTAATDDRADYVVTLRWQADDEA